MYKLPGCAIAIIELLLILSLVIKAFSSVDLTYLIAPIIIFKVFFAAVLCFITLSNPNHIRDIFPDLSKGEAVMSAVYCLALAAFNMPFCAIGAAFQGLVQILIYQTIYGRKEIQGSREN